MRQAFVPPLTFDLRSGANGDVYRAFVSLPRHPVAPGHRMPLVITSEANFYFAALAGLTQSLQLCDVPPFLLVGIGYPGESPAAGWLRRLRDLAFDGYPIQHPEPPEIEGVLRDPIGFREADRFTSFIERDLIPELDRRFHTRGSSRYYFGHSIGGSYGLYVLLSGTDLFDGYIISSPGIGFAPAGGARQDFVIDRLCDGPSSVASPRLYLAAGSAEDAEPAFAGWDLKSNALRFADAIRTRRPSLDVRVEIFPNMRHAAVWAAAFANGVSALIVPNPDNPLHPII